MRGCRLVAAVVAWGLSFPASTEADVVFFTDRVAWESAAGPTSFTENFSGFSVDSSFRASPAVLNGMAIQQEGTERLGWNEVDVPPHQFSPNSGSSSALLLTNSPEGARAGTQVRITFPGPNKAFGFESWSGNDGEGVVLDVFSGATLLGSQALTGGDGDFLGYVLTGEDMSSSVRFRSDGLIPGTVGERFYIDNLTGTTGAVRQAQSDFIYWSDFNGGNIRRANLDGSEETILVSGQANPVGPALDPAGGQMYWGNVGGGSIRRANLDGSVKMTVISGLAGPGAPALDLVGGRMYWNNSAGGTIQRANLDGSGRTTLVRGLDDPHAVALDLTGGKIYWPDFGSGTIQRANLDGSGLETLVEGLASPALLALDIEGDRMYWTTMGSGDIRRANLDGSGQEVLVENLDRPAGIALDIAGGLMYWTDIGSGSIQRANLDGSGQQTLITGLPGPGFIVLGK